MKNKAIYTTCLLSTILLFAGHAKATFIMTLEQVGTNVVATGSGSIDLTDLTALLWYAGPSYIGASSADLIVGSAGIGFDQYTGISGPTQFGTGGYFFASTGSGDQAGIENNAPGRVAVPHQYVSGTLLSSDATWDNTTLAALGVTPGTYTWTWGSGAHADSLTLDIVAPPSLAPEPASLLLIGGGMAALGLWRVHKAARLRLRL